MTSVRLLVLALGASIGVIFPFTAVILGSFGFTPGEVGASLSLASLASVIAVPTWGHLADVRLGRARALQACVGIGSDAVFWAAAGSATIAAILGFLAFPVRSSRAPVRLPA